MAEKRMISTRFFTSSVAVRLGDRFPARAPHAMAVFLALILEADDHGRGRYAPVTIRAAAFASAPDTIAEITLENVDCWCREIAADGAIVLYGDNGRGGPAYYAFPKWHDYQKIQYRKKSHIPDPPEIPAP